MTERWGLLAIFRRVIIPNGSRFIPKGFISIFFCYGFYFILFYISKGHYSEDFYPEKGLIWFDFIWHIIKQYRYIAHIENTIILKIVIIKIYTYSKTF